MFPDEMSAYTGHLAEMFGRVVADVFTEEVLRRGAGGEVTPALLGVLECLHRRGVCSVGELARGLGVSYAAGSQFIQRLEAKGLVSRGEDAQDRRRSSLRLTSEGERLVAGVAEVRAEKLNAVLGRMDGECREALVRGLEAFLAEVMRDQVDLEHFCARCGIPHSAECVVDRVSVSLTGRSVVE